MRVFEAESPLLLERAFQSWRLRSNFVPTVREIYQLIEEEAIAAYQEREQEAWDRWREEARAARETWLDPKQKTALDEICADLGKRLRLARMNNLPQKRERIENVVARSQAKALRAIRR